jgi:SnoaL-like protein
VSVATWGAPRASCGVAYRMTRTEEKPHDGTTARAQWYLFMSCTLGESNRAMWRAGVDHEEYVRVAGEWKFKRKTSAPLFHTPFEEGWVKMRFV